MFADILVVSLRLARPPDPAYPPGATGDHGTLAFMLVAGGFGFASIVVGIIALCNCFNKSAEKGPKRRVVRYIPMFVDVIFMGLVVGAIIVSRETLPA